MHQLDLCSDVAKGAHEATFKMMVSPVGCSDYGTGCSCNYCENRAAAEESHREAETCTADELGLTDAQAGRLIRRHQQDQATVRNRRLTRLRQAKASKASRKANR